MSSALQPHPWYRNDNLARLLVALVLTSNLYAAIGFYFSPQNFTAAYELVGAPGEAALAGFGLLFAMWQVPYLVALIDPLKHKVSLMEALAMQSLGVVGEALILLRIPASHVILKSGVTRFILFDLAGLALLIAAFLVVNRIIRENESKI